MISWHLLIFKAKKLGRLLLINKARGVEVNAGYNFSSCKLYICIKIYALAEYITHPIILKIYHFYSQVLKYGKLDIGL